MLKSLFSKFSQANITGNTSESRQQLQAPWQQARYLALDLETDGLEAGKDRILAFGWVPVAPPRIRLYEADYGVIRSEYPLSQSAVIHQLREQDMRSGEPVERILKRLASQLHGRVLVAHHATFDWAFLQPAFAQAGIECTPLALMDTLRMEKNRLARKKDWLNKGELTLGACRERYGLPPMRQHHALSDAIACAELFLAQAYRIAGAEKVSLKSLLRYA